MGWTAVVVAVAMVAVGCSDGGGSEQGGDGATATAPTPATEEPLSAAITVGELDEATDAIVGEWGDEGGFAVVLLALDRGYTVEQIVAHPRIDVTGSIAGVVPAGSALGLIEPPAASTADNDEVDEESMGSPDAPAAVPVAYVAQEDEESPAQAYVAFVDSTLGEIFSAARERIREQQEQEQEEAAFEGHMTNAVLGLVARGYSVEQVIDALLTRSVRSDEHATLLCLVIAEAGSRPPYLAPEGTDLMGEECPAPSTSDAPADQADGKEPGESVEASGNQAVPADDGLLEWTGEMAPTNLGEPWSPDGPANVLITRTPGTNEFEIVLGASITATGTVTGCTSIEDKTFEGTGTFVSDDRIEFPGTYVNDRGGTCTDDPVDQTLENTLAVEITETGLALPNWEGFSFELPGVPVRLDE